LKYFFETERFRRNLMGNKEKDKAQSNDRYTIFHALFDVMEEKKQRKSRWTRFLNYLGFRK
jgi:hypothetical protein